MPLTVTVVPQFPDVPFLPGVPVVPRNPISSLAALLSVPLLAGDSFTDALSPFPQWGIFDPSGNPVATGDAVVSIDFRRQYNIPTYPVEQGGFQNYNKVELPYEVGLVFTVGGSQSDRAAFIGLVDGLTRTTQTYNAVTPEATYLNVNVYDYSYRRETGNNANLLKIEVRMRKVRQTAYTQYANTQQPDGAAPQSNGYTQPQQPASAPDFMVG